MTPAILRRTGNALQNGLWSFHAAAAQVEEQYLMRRQPEQRASFLRSSPGAGVASAGAAKQL